MGLSTCHKCGGHIPLGPNETNRCTQCGEHVMGSKPPACKWEWIVPGMWAAPCVPPGVDNARTWLPQKNQQDPTEFRFCPYCGKPMEWD